MTGENQLFAFLILCWLWWLLQHHAQCVAIDDEGVAQPRHPWQLRPRTPKDCAQCPCPKPHGQKHQEVIPWSQMKSQRGRPRPLVSEGQSCPNPSCGYHGIPDQSLPALVVEGVQGVKEAIQCWCCQACGERLSERHDTAMRCLKTPSWRVQEVVTALAEGVDQAAAVRIFGHHPTTIARWLKRAGQLDMPLHERTFKDIFARYIQLDELKTKTRQMGEVWVWVALDVQTGVMIALKIGPHTQANAHALIHEVRACWLKIVFPSSAAMACACIFMR